MGHTPEYLARRRRSRARRRRVIGAGIALTALIWAAAATVYFLNRGHHGHVVRIPGRDSHKPHQHERAKPKHGASEYHAAPGAQSLSSVRTELEATEHPRTSAATSSAGASALLSSAAKSSFEQFAASSSGRIEVALAPLGAGEADVLGDDEPAHGWSTTKVPVLVALLRARGAGGLTAQERAWAQSAITESNNESVLSLFGDLKQLKGGLGGASAYIEELLRMSGDDETTVPTAPPPAGAVTTFGQTEWSPGDAVKFFRALALGCLLPAAQTSYVLGLMENIEPGESWGLGSAGFASVAFKGGWGPESNGYLVRQSGIIDPGSASGVAVAIVNFAPSFGAGTETLTRAATWLKAHLQLSPRPSAGCPATA